MSHCVKGRHGIETKPTLVQLQTAVKCMQEHRQAALKNCVLTLFVRNNVLNFSPPRSDITIPALVLHKIGGCHYHYSVNVELQEARGKEGGGGGGGGRESLAAE